MNYFYDGCMHFKKYKASKYKAVFTPIISLEKPGDFFNITLIVFS